MGYGLRVTDHNFLFYTGMYKIQGYVYRDETFCSETFTRNMLVVKLFAGNMLFPGIQFKLIKQEVN